MSAEQVPGSRPSIAPPGFGDSPAAPYLTPVPAPPTNPAPQHVAPPAYAPPQPGHAPALAQPAYAQPQTYAEPQPVYAQPQPPYPQPQPQPAYPQPAHPQYGAPAAYAQVAHGGNPYPGPGYAQPAHVAHPAGTTSAGGGMVYLNPAAMTQAAPAKSVPVAKELDPSTKRRNLIIAGGAGAIVGALAISHFLHGAHPQGAGGVLAAMGLVGFRVWHMSHRVHRHLSR